MAISTLDEAVVDELIAICGEEHVFTGRSALFNRAPEEWTRRVLAFLARSLGASAGVPARAEP